MKINKIVLLAAMLLCLAGCTKENVAGDTHDGAATSSVTYLVGGQRYYSNPQTDEDWSAFFDRMFALAKEGYAVRIVRTDANRQVNTSKEKVTYTTDNYNDAKAWAKQKTLEGYEVTITFNQQTGIYTCIATR